MQIIGTDVESYLIKPGLLAPPLVCVSAAWNSNGRRVTTLLDKNKGSDFYKTCLQDKGTILVLHNGVFDMGVSAAFEPELVKPIFHAYAEGRIRCTQIRQELIDIAIGRKSINGTLMLFDEDRGEWIAPEYHLASLMMRFFGKDRSAEKSDPNGWRLRYAELDGIPTEVWPEKARNYAIEDSEDALDLYWHQAEQAKRLGILKDEATGEIVNEVEQNCAHWALHLASVWGMRTDPERTLELEDKLLGLQETTRKRLIRAGILKERPATKKERDEGKVDFYNKAGKACRWSTDKKKVQAYVQRWASRHNQEVTYTDRSERYPEGQVATDKDSLNLTGSRLLKMLADGGGVDKILTTYVPALKFGTKFPITARFNVLVNSGRTSCSKPNLQNQPTGRRVGGTRECFVPRPGFAYVSVDYKTQELKALAQICLWLFGRSRMAEVINTGRDLHLAMAANILKLSYEETEAAKKATDKGLEPENKDKWLSILGSESEWLAKDYVSAVKAKIKRARDCAKVANFGLPGGLGAQSLVDYARAGYGVIISFEDAQILKRQWLDTWPEMQQYFSYVNAQIGFDGNAKVRQFWSNRIRGGIGYCDGCNTFFQGLSADCSKRALFRICYEMYCVPSSPLFGCRFGAFIHDEFLFEALLNKIHEAGCRAAEIAVQAMKEICPDVLHEAEPAACLRWYKEAEPVFNEEGKLIPWEPKLKAA